MVKGDKARKSEYFNRIGDMFRQHERVLLFTADHVGSMQMHKVRRELRGKGTILMGKNTMIRKAVRGLFTEIPALEKLLPHIEGNVGLLFTNYRLQDMVEILTSDRKAAPAKAGVIAPVDVHLEAHVTTQGPEKTSFFQALGIATKITKGQIEILNPVHLVKQGNKVGPSEAVLLQMLKRLPFTYGLEPTVVFDEGSVYHSELLLLPEDHFEKSFQNTLSLVTAVSLSLKYPTVLAVPHILIDTYKKVLAVAVETDYSFPLADKVKEILKDPSAFVVAAPAGDAAAPAEEKKEEAPPEPEEESDEDMGFGLFD